MMSSLFARPSESELGAAGQVFSATPPHMAVGGLSKSRAESARQSWMATTPGSSSSRVNASLTPLTPSVS